MIAIAYRNIVITRSTRIKSKNKQLQLLMESEENYSIPIEDINSMMIESEKVQISSHALRELSLNGTAVYLCDEQHMPCGVLLPLNSHSRQLKVLQMQLDMKKPLKKRLWQQIVQQKISNQAECLKICEKSGYEALAAMVKKVQSGDSTYMEAQAAAKYFKLLYGSNFKRKNKPSGLETDIINAALNYGYSIIRAVIARNLVVYGLEPAMGIFHHSETNRFNLADDLLEAFRPVVDLFTAQNIIGEKLTPENKRQLYNLLNIEIRSGNENHSLMYAAERTVKSFAAVCRDNGGSLILPVLSPLKVHCYE